MSPEQIQWAMTGISAIRAVEAGVVGLLLVLFLIVGCTVLDALSASIRQPVKWRTLRRWWVSRHVARGRTLRHQATRRWVRPRKGA